ncbi:uncharacterized protein [Halyomorpha halys]|uniref:uncharacterized protein isoform X2 n=1 Tax=Halyomorpha halys TaxID=286706 RepID=UPI0034D2A411
MEVSEAQEQEVAFSDWTDKLEAGTSHWLPAYGFQQPSQLHEALLQQDYEVSQQSYVYLETIVEETSDDLRSESEYSAGGWPDTDSDAGSVIHLPVPLGNGPIAQNDWSGSERDLAVPKKRRRRIYNTDPGVHDDEDDEEEILPPLSSRSSSLLQFETLEKQCETVFRTTASAEPFHSPSLASSFSFDSLETSRWRFSGSPDSLDGGQSTISSSCSSSSHISSSDEERVSRSFSSRSGNESYRSSLKSHRSFDSLVNCQEKTSSLNGEFSQSLNNTMLAVEEEEPTTAPPRCLYQTVECLNEVAGKPASKPQETKKKSQRSAENLSEDSGFGEHIPRGHLRRASSSGGFAGAEQEDTGSQPKIDRQPGWGEANYSYWQSAPDLLDQSRSAVEKVSTTSLIFPAHEEDTDIPESKGFNMNTVSTPNLYGEELEDGEYELKFGDNTLNRAHSFKEGELRKSKSKGSNIQITTSFINLNASAGSLHSKVHFSPVVSEVSFRDTSEEELTEKVGKDVKVTESGGGPQHRPVVVEQPVMEQPAKKNKIGGFFQRFSLRRLSGRDKKKKEKKWNGAQQQGPQKTVVAAPEVEDVQIIPLHPPEAKPPKAPQRLREPPPDPSAMPTAPRAGLLETDLDTVHDGPPKTRSLLDLGAGGSRPNQQPPSSPVDNRAKSMEFLLDKQAQFSVKICYLGLHLDEQD